MTEQIVSGNTQENSPKGALVAASATATAPDPQHTTQTTAKMLRAAGYSFLPIKIDGTKEPGLEKWAELQDRQPTEKEEQGWFYARPNQSTPSRGIAAIMGRLIVEPGNRETTGKECIDGDDFSLYEPLRARVEERQPGLWNRLVVVKTPRPGFQLHYRCAVIGKNRKLAWHEIPADSGDDEKVKYQNESGQWVKKACCIETRGIGGYTVTVGSHIKTHKTRRPYEFLQGDFSTVQVITEEERALLFECCATFSTVPLPKHAEHKERAEREDGQLLPGDDFAERGDIAGLLEKHGWKFVRESSVGQLWQRPGKDEGASATLFENGNFYVFTTSTEFESETCYSPLGMYAVLEHGGDFSAAARALYQQGFGTRHTPSKPPSSPAESQQESEEPGVTEAAPAFAVQRGEMCYWESKHAAWRPVCNFTARIVKDTLEDDEVEQRREYLIESRIAGENKTRTGRVRAEDYTKLQWVEKIVGAGATIYPRQAEYMRAGVKALSADREEETIIAHAGWRKDGDTMRFYSASGVIDANGFTPGGVKLEGGLGLYELTTPLVGEDLHQAWAAFEKMRTVMGREIMIPLIGGCLMPVIGAPDFSIFASGTTGHGKSTHALLALSLFGRQFGEGKPPTEWEGSTLYGLQVMAHRAKNLPLLIDEYKPRASRDGQKMQYVATTYLQSQGNRSGRAGGRPDGSLRAERYPRGGTIATGEDIPPTTSLRARLVIVSFPNEMSTEHKARLSPLQAKAREGVFAGLMSAYLQWLAGGQPDQPGQARIAGYLQGAHEQINTLREEWQARLAPYKLHARTPSNFATLERAWKAFLAFGVSAGLVTEAAAKAIHADVVAGLQKCAENQSQYLVDSDPVKRYVSLVGVALASGRAHLQPSSGNLNGWTEDERRMTGWVYDREEWRPRGEMIGWIDDDLVYVLPDPARRIVDSFQVAGEGIALGQRQLNTQLKEAGCIIPDPKRGTATRRKSFNGASSEVLFFRRETIFSKAESEPDSADEIPAF